MTADVSEHGQRPGCDHGAANGQSVQPVGKVDGIAGPDNHQHDENYEWQKRQRPKSGL